MKYTVDQDRIPVGSLKFDEVLERNQAVASSNLGPLHLMVLGSLVDNRHTIGNMHSVTRGHTKGNAWGILGGSVGHTSQCFE